MASIVHELPASVPLPEAAPSPPCAKRPVRPATAAGGWPVSAVNRSSAR